MENTRGTEDPAAVPVSGKSPATGPKGGPTFGTKLSQHTHPHRISGTKLSPHTHPHRISGIKLSLLTRNGSIWRFLCMQGEFCTVLTTKKPSRESYAPFSPPRSQAGQTVYRTQGRDQASQHNNTPGPTGVKRAEGAGAPRRGAGGRRQEHSQTNFAHNFPRSLFETTRKRCNPNEANSRFEQVARELRAKLLNIPGTTTMKSAAGAGGSGCGAHGRRRGLAGLRDDAPSRRLAARTARGRAAAHGHTEQPGPTAGPPAPGTPAEPAATTHPCMQKTDIRIGCRPVVELGGFEPPTFSLRTRRATNCAIAPRTHTA